MPFSPISGPQDAATVIGSFHASSDWFGSALAADGEYVAVGASGTSSSSVFVFERDGSGNLVEAIRLTHPGSFGVSVDLRGTTLVAGASLYTGAYANEGRVYVYERTLGTWTLNQEIPCYPPANIQTNTLFGRCVAFSADASVLVISRPGGTSPSVYIYRKNVGTGLYEHEQTLVGTGSGAEFGLGVAISSDGTRVIAGYYAGASGKGCVYIFEYSAGTWSETAIITPVDAASSDRFGCRVAICGDTIAASSPGNDEAGTSWGAVYIFRLIAGTWTQLHKAMPRSRLYNYANYMGGSFTSASGVGEEFKLVFKNENVLFVPCPWDNAVGSTGTLRVLTAVGNWTDSTENLITAYPLSSSAYFGHCCLSGENVVVGRLQGGNPGGSSYGCIYDVSDTRWLEASGFVSTYFLMRGYRPGTADFETWTAVGAPNVANPSGQPIVDVTVVAKWTA